MKTTKPIIIYRLAMILTHLNFQENNISVIVKRSNRKTISLRVKNEKEIVISAPIQVKNDFLIELLQKKEKWICQKLHLQNRRKATLESCNRKQENHMLFRNRFYPIEYSASQSIELKKDTCFFPQNAKKMQSFHLQQWYKKQCWQFMAKFLPYWAQKIGVTYTSFRISEAKSYWGTCNNRGTISISWRIMMAPEAVHHYLLIHELCHRAYMNHSKEFWQLVERIYPDYKKAKNWLKEYSHILKNTLS